MYQSTVGPTKLHITMLVAIGADGSVIPLMHIFPGERFSYNLLIIGGGVTGAYFGISDTGWMKTHHFDGWIVNHFAQFVKQRPALFGWTQDAH